MRRIGALADKYGKRGQNEYDYNYYLLLKIKAANNAYKPLTDSTVFRVLDFFKNAGDKNKLCQSYYYLGKILCKQE